MSRFENYSSTSQAYDSTRVIVGIDVVLDVCAALPDGFAALDCGCGTGNYLVALSERTGGRMARIAGIDVNEGMLERAREKLGDDARAIFVQGPIYDLPFGDDEFDLVLNTQVLHHLDQDETFPNVRAFLGEARRVLRPGGVLAINTTTHAQWPAAYWWASLIPEAGRKLRDRLPDLPFLTEALGAAGFREIRTVVPEGVLQGKAYFDRSGPLDPAWRDGDSTWSLASDDELAAALEQVSQLIDSGEMEPWFAAHEARRIEFGQSTFILAG
jgi:ubiquinone/menaquinone biosynthesis C-methylase UbiE